MADLQHSSAVEGAGNPKPRYSSFVPVAAIAIGFILVLGWQLQVTTEAGRSGRQLREQQARMVEQSTQIQAGLEKLARDLIETARTDEDAKALVTKYKINVTNPVPAQAPAASPSPSP